MVIITLNMMLFYFIFICFTSCTHGIKLHEHMTKQEIESTFNVAHELVHEVEYEVTPILLVNRLDNKGQSVQIAHSAAHLRAFNENISLYLLENDNSLLGSHTPVFMAKRSRRASSFGAHPQIVYSRMQFPMPENLKLYHDIKKRAAVTVFTDEDNKAHVYGTIGEDYIVKPIPTRLQKEILPKFPHLYQSSFSYKRPSPFSDDPFFSDPFSGNSLSGNLYKPTHHIVIKPKVQVNSAYYDPTEGHWNHLKQQWHNTDSDESDENDLSNPFLSWINSFRHSDPRRPAAQAPPSWRPVPKKPIDWSPENREPAVWEPATNQPSKPHATPRDPWHLPANKFPTWPPSQNSPMAQYPTGQQPIYPQTPGGPGKPIAKYSNTVYPELLVSIDYETYAAHGSNLKELAQYMAAFWNAVDLRFRELSQPQVRLNIAGLIVPQTRDSAPYFQDSRVNNEALEADRTVSDIGRYFSHEDQFPKNMYDIAVAISHLDLGSFTPNGKFNDGTTGIAMLGGACKVQTGQAAALIRDKGGFNGITTAAHELAHSMGAPHDGDGTRDFPGGPCPWSDGYLMSYERQDSRGMHWSRCSKIAMSKYLSSPEAQCMRNKPDVGTPYRKILPGKILSRDDQCSRSLGVGWFSDKEQESNCAVLHCRRPLSATEFTFMNEMRPPAEGSYCGSGAICLDAQCVRDPTTSQNKPDVGTPYPTFLPGKVLSRDEQCSKLLGNNYFSVKGTESNCKFLWCQEPGLSNSFPKSLEKGSHCGPGAICLDKQCVRDPTI